MLKKNIFLLMLMIGIIASSCSNNGKEAETKNPEDVKVTTSETTTTFKNIKEGSFVNWRASHLGGVQKRFGKVSLKEATFLVDKGGIKNATVLMDMSSLTVENFPEGNPQIEKLKGHLLSNDFFSIEKFPTSKFELTNVEAATGTYNSKVTGNLTILGVTKSITFNANINVSDNEVSVKSEDFSVNRTDWGLSYNTEGTAGVPVDYLIANNIGFTINATVAK